MLPLRRGDLLEVVLMLISIVMEATERAWLDFCNVVNVIFTNISILCGTRRQRFRGTSRRQRFKGTSRRQPFKGSLSISRESPILQQQPPTATLPQHRTNTTLFKASTHVEGQKDKLSVDEEWRQQRHQGQAIPLEGQQYMLDLTANTQKNGRVPGYRAQILQIPMTLEDGREGDDEWKWRYNPILLRRRSAFERERWLRDSREKLLKKYTEHSTPNHSSSLLSQETETSYPEDVVLSAPRKQMYAQAPEEPLLAEDGWITPASRRLTLDRIKSEALLLKAPSSSTVSPSINVKATATEAAETSFPINPVFTEGDKATDTADTAKTAELTRLPEERPDGAPDLPTNTVSFTYAPVPTSVPCLAPALPPPPPTHPSSFFASLSSAKCVRVGQPFNSTASLAPEAPPPPLQPSVFFDKPTGSYPVSAVVDVSVSTVSLVNSTASVAPADAPPPLQPSALFAGQMESLPAPMFMHISPSFANEGPVLPFANVALAPSSVPLFPITAAPTLDKASPTHMPSAITSYSVPEYQFQAAPSMTMAAPARQYQAITSGISSVSLPVAAHNSFIQRSSQNIDAPQTSFHLALIKRKKKLAELEEAKSGRRKLSATALTKPKVTTAMGAVRKAKVGDGALPEKIKVMMKTGKKNAMRMMAGWEPLPFASIASPAPHVPPAPLPQSAKVSILCFLGDLRQAKPYTDPKTKMKGVWFPSFSFYQQYLKYQASVMTAEVMEAFNAYQQEFEEHINTQVRTGAFYPFSKIIADIFEKRCVLEDQRAEKAREKQVTDVRVQHAALAVTSSLPQVSTSASVGSSSAFSGFASASSSNTALNPSVQKASLNVKAPHRSLFHMAVADRKKKLMEAETARNGRGKVGATTLTKPKATTAVTVGKAKVGGSIPGKIVDMLKISKEDAIRMIAGLEPRHFVEDSPSSAAASTSTKPVVSPAPPPQSAADLSILRFLGDLKQAKVLTDPKSKLRGVWFPSNPYYRGYITFRATSSNAQTIQALSAYKQEASETPGANAKIGVFYPFSKIAADIIEKYYVMQPRKANEQRRLQSLDLIAQISTLADFILEFGANPSGGEDEPIYDIARVAPLLGHLFRAVSTTDANGVKGFWFYSLDFGDRFIDYKAKALDSRAIQALNKAKEEVGERRTKPFPAGGIFYSFKQLARRVRMKFYYFKDLADIEELERRSTDNVETRKVATGVTAETIGKPKPNVKTGMSASVVNGKNIETRKVVAGVKVGTIGKAKPNVKIGMSANAVNALKSHIAALPTQVNKLGSVNVSQPGSNSAPAQPQLRPIAPANVQYTQTTLLGPQTAPPAIQRIVNAVRRNRGQQS